MNRKEAGKAVSRINYGLFFVAAAAQGKYQGCLVNSLHQVTSSLPYQFSLTVNKSNETCKAIQAAGSFSGMILAGSISKELTKLFGYKSGRAVNKFEGLDLETDSLGNPYLKEGVLARISCKVTSQIEVGNFILFIGEVVEAEAMSNGPALTLNDFLDEGMTAPSTATVYRTLEENTGWKCTVCGYVTDKEELPTGYQCPICRANRDKFVKL